MNRAGARIGTAGWAIPAACRAAMPGDGGTLERYGAALHATEINSSFHRRHKPETYARWAASVADDFRFAVKLPKTVSHERRLVDCADLLVDFASDIAGLGGKRGPVLLQLPPSFAFDSATAAAFFDSFAARVGGVLACEPRHASWFAPEADALLAAHRIARVAADPAKAIGGDRPGGWRGLAYHRLHGSPRVYWSSYDAATIAAQARLVADDAARGVECWTIYDNTAGGAALANALELRDEVCALHEDRGLRVDAA